MCSEPATFLLQYQQPAIGQNDLRATGTMTKTSAREAADQDVESRTLLSATRTFTETREQTDQDPSGSQLLGTGTRTDSRESADQDPSHVGWSVIPRR